MHLRFEMPDDDFAVDVYDALFCVVKEKPYREFVPDYESPGQIYMVYIVSLSALSHFTLGCAFARCAFPGRQAGPDLFHLWRTWTPPETPRGRSNGGASCSVLPSLPSNPNPVPPSANQVQHHRRPDHDTA